MKSQKVTVNIKVESLSIDCLRNLLCMVIEQVDKEVEDGHLNMQDGDSVSWNTVREDVEF